MKQDLQTQYVSRGGTKLAHALREFHIVAKDRIVLDIGAGQGGFTDCLLQAGARRVYAIDVGYGVVDWKLRQDPCVTVVERTNIRYLTPDKLYVGKVEEANLAVIDLSFISVAKCLPTIWELFEPPRELVILVKPQFEAARSEVQKGGKVRDPEVHARVIEKICHALDDLGWMIRGICSSPIRGRTGNIEFFVHGASAASGSGRGMDNVLQMIQEVVAEAHQRWKE